MFCRTLDELDSEVGGCVAGVAVESGRLVTGRRPGEDVRERGESRGARGSLATLDHIDLGTLGNGGQRSEKELEKLDVAPSSRSEKFELDLI